MQPESLKEKVLYRNMQALRGFAALLVCAYHFRISINTDWSEIAFGNGWIGVQIFFMISGYIMVHTTNKIKDDFKNNSVKFMLNRFIRILPLYYLITFFYIADDINDGYLFTQSALVLKSLLFIAPFTSTKGPQYGMPCLEVGWTLNYEMLFYFLFAVSILFGTRRYWFMYVVFAILLIFIPLFSGSVLSSDYLIFRNYKFEYLNFMSNPIWIHFVFGVTLGLLLPKIKINKSFSRYSFYASILLFLIYYTGFLNIEYNAINDLFFCGFLLTSFLLNDLHTEGIILPDSIVKLGNQSFSMYLLHPLIFSYLHTVFDKIDMHFFTNTIAFFMLAILLTILISFLFYYFFELKITAYLKKIIFGKIWG
ncbi:MAG: acyltransferase [Bacteroidetes bacterium]|nr:acyltransferase [Bacteroidota bacterium]